MEENKVKELNNKNIEELGVYYLYFICIFLEKTFNKVKGISIDSHHKIKFSKILNEDFKKSCDEIEIISNEFIYEFVTYKDLNVNFCHRFMYFINDMYERKKINVEKIREIIYEDIKYLSYYYFGIFLTEKSIMIESVIEYFDKIINEILCNQIKGSLFVFGNIEDISLDYNNEYLDCNQSESKNNDESKDESDFYFDAKSLINDKIIIYNNKIGFRLVDKIIKPYLKNLLILSKTCFKGINDTADLYVSYFYQNLQNDYLFKYVNSILNIKNIDDIIKFIENDEQTKFISQNEMEELIKDG